MTRADGYPVAPGAAVVLSGDAYSRGLQQAEQCPTEAAAVRAAVDGRLAGQEQVLASAKVANFLAAQWDFARDQDPAGIAETRGIAAGFGIAPETLFAYLHMNIVADLAQAPAPRARSGEGCTAWAAPGAGGGAWVVKNRDYRGEHGALQRVFRHEDPAWGSRVMLCVGSLGSPGAFSSGINSDGLAVVDTQIGTSDHGVGWLRYYLMTDLLRRCATVAEALERITRLPHAGGGTVVLGDASGAIAAAELGHGSCALESGPDRWMARTNHYTDARLAATMIERSNDDLARSSVGRRARVCEALESRQGALQRAEIQALMASHDQHGRAGLCRHAEADGTRTLSSAIYHTRIGSLVISAGSPCTGPWRSYALADAFGHP